APFVHVRLHTCRPTSRLALSETLMAPAVGEVGARASFNPCNHGQNAGMVWSERKVGAFTGLLRTCDCPTRVRPGLLDDGIPDTLVSVGRPQLRLCLRRL